MARQDQIGKLATSVATGADGVTRVTYHATAVVAFDAKRVTLDSGGYRTNTTKTRMNQTANQFRLGFRVFQHDHEWFVRRPDGGEMPFVDGMSFAR